MKLKLQQVISTFLCIAIFSTISFAAKFHASSNDLWNKASTWSENAVPGELDTVYIDGHQVVINSEVTVSQIFITNESGTAVSSLIIQETATMNVSNDIIVTATNKNFAVSFQIHDSSILTVQGDLNFLRTIDNNFDYQLFFQVYENAKVYVLGNFTYDYGNAGDGEAERDIILKDSGLLDISGLTNLITRNGIDLDLLMLGNSKLILRDSLSLLLYGGKETAITVNDNATLELLDNAYLQNSGGTNHTKIKSGQAGGTISITGDVIMDSQVDGFEVKLEVNGPNTTLEIMGDIAMKAVGDGDVFVDLKNTGILNFGGNFIRDNFGALRMTPDASIVFNGTTPQAIPQRKISGSGIDSLYFGKTQFKNTSGQPIVLTENMVITDSLYLEKGIIQSSESAMIIIEESAGIRGGNELAYIDGPLMKKGTTNSQPFTFPIGKNNIYAPLTISEITNAGAEFTAEYYTDPPPFGGDPNERETTIGSITNQYWQLTSNSSSNTVTPSLSWLDAAAIGITDPNDMTFAKGDPVTEFFSDWGQSSNTGGSTGAGSITSMMTDPPPFGGHNSIYTIGFQASALPVELTKFKAAQVEDNVYLKWETATERNVNQFIVERSVDGILYKEIGSVLSGGNSTTSKIYTHKDLNPNVGENYYRLKILDNDHTFEYSNIEVVQFKKNSVIKIFPNPIEEVIKIEGIELGNKENMIEIFDQNGKVVYVGTAKFEEGKTEILVDTLGLETTGTYFLRITGNLGSHVIKFFKVN